MRLCPPLVAPSRGSSRVPSRTSAVYSAPTDRSTGIICDQTISLDGFYTRQDYPELLRRIRFKDPESGKTLVFITNNFSLPAATSSTKAAWNSSSIKQHLRIKQFYGTSENAVKADLEVSVTSSSPSSRSASPGRLALHFVTDPSVTLFEKMPIHQACGRRKQCNASQITNQLNLFDF